MVVKVAIALLSNIEATQNEIISAIFSQAIEFIDGITVIDFYANNKLNKVLNTTPDILNMRQYTYNSWKEIYNHYVEEMQEFDKVIIFKTPLICCEDMLNEMEEQMELDDSYTMEGYEKMRKICERLMFVKAIRDKEVYQFVIDPREYDFSKYWEFKKYKRVCTWTSKVGDKYGPIYEYSMVNTFIQEIPKMQDIYFIASAFDESRDYLFTDFRTEFDRRLNKRHKGGVLNNPFSGKFEIYDKRSKDKRVSQSTYMYNLMLSRYTLIIPPYVKERFNIMRFMEAIICNCFPLSITHYDNSLIDLRLTFPDIFDIIRKGTYINSTLQHVFLRPDKLYEKDKNVLTGIKQTDSFKKITDKESVQRFYNKLLR